VIPSAVAELVIVRGVPATLTLIVTRRVCPAGRSPSLQGRPPLRRSGRTRAVALVIVRPQ
jgi:hypothetical protein